MKRYLLTKGNYYKANLHCHSTLSDGKWTVEEIKRRYREKGYSVIAYTDHERLYLHNDLSDDNFLALNGYEYAVNKPDGSDITCHLNLFCKTPDVDTPVGFHAPDDGYWRREYSPSFLNRILAEANANGFFVSVNHPAWSLQTFTDYKDLEGLWAIETYNHSSARGGFHEDSNHIYDKMLRAGKRLFPTSTDDNHNGRGEYDSFGGFDMIRADRLDYATIVDALLKGDFYASCGPLFEEIYIEDDLVHVRCSPVREIRMLTEGRDGMIARWKDGLCAATSSKATALDFRASLRKDDSLTEAVFELDRAFCGKYIRFDLRDKQGRFADTRAYFLDEWEADNKGGDAR